MQFTDIPHDILKIIYEKLDSYSKLRLQFCCKQYYDYFYDKRLLMDCNNEYAHLLHIKRLVHKYITRNIFIDMYTLHGECEQCHKIGFLQEIEVYDEFTNSVCICIDHI
jgi:hypothetical protein